MTPKSSIAAPYISALQQHSFILRYILDEDGQDVSDMLNAKRFKKSDCGFTYRQINSWDEHGLIDSDRKGPEWRTFSYMDHVWLCLIREMRKYGISLKQIARIKKFLTDGTYSVKDRSSMLEFYVANLCTRKQACVLIIFEDASAMIWPYDQWLSQQVGDKVPNHVMIHLNPIWQELFPKNSLLPDYKRNIGWALDEFQLLRTISGDKYETVEITYKNGKVDLLKGMKRVETTKKIADILRENAYQKIEIDQSAGGITRILQWKKIKIDKA